jgi:ligand-binding SRPBCC domain-containing protein
LLYELHREQFILKPRQIVFEFFERPENLARMTPPWLNLVTLTPSPIQMAQGLRIDYAIRILGMRWRWTSLITQYEPPQRFRDEQVRGPYRLWEHQHEFQEKDGGTLVTDHIRYRLPYGVLGEAIHALYVRRALRKIFDFRRQTLALLLS